VRSPVVSLAFAAALIVVAAATPADANFLSYSRGLKPSSAHIAFEAPTMAPMAYTRFCISYPEECQARRGGLKRRALKLSDERWGELVSVNQEVNGAIAPARNVSGLRTEAWLIAPDAGDCNDYAVTKRHRLIAGGWFPSSLLLAEVVTRAGEHHLVLVVRTRSGDFVLDNLTGQVLPWSRTAYQWLRIQSPRNPNYWFSVAAA
jgi:predicted transglutaminase-like cysteine proteinase